MDSRQPIAPAGWYEDWGYPARERWWDGERWTDILGRKPHLAPPPAYPAQTPRSGVPLKFGLMCTAFGAALLTYTWFKVDLYSTNPIYGLSVFTAFLLGPVVFVALTVELARLGATTTRRDRRLVVAGLLMGLAGAALMLEPFIWGMASQLSGF